MIPEAICEPSGVRPASPSTKLTPCTLETKSSRRTTESPDPVSSELDNAQATSNLDVDSPKRLEIVDYEEEAEEHDSGKEVEHEDNGTNNLVGFEVHSNEPQSSNKDGNSNDANNHDEIERSCQKLENTRQDISFRIELDSVSTDVGSSPAKKLKDDKKRFQEMIVEGFAIRAFLTWEDLQDEVRESKILMEREKKDQQSDIKKPNSGTSANGTTAVSSTTKSTSKSRSTSGSKKSCKSRSSNSKQLSPSKGANSSKVTSRPQPNSNAQSENIKSHEPPKPTAATNLNDQSSGGNALNNADKLMEQNRQNLPQNDQHQAKQSSHDKSLYPTDGYHNFAPKSNSNPPPGPATQHQFNPPVNCNQFYVSDQMHNQNRPTGPNYVNPRAQFATAAAAAAAQHDSIRAAQTYPYATPYNNPRVAPHPPPPPQGPSHPPQIPESQTAQQYFQQYHQFYRHMQYPSHQPYPALQTPYYASINQPQSNAPPRGPIVHPQSIRPQPPLPPTSIPAPNSSSLVPPYGAHPYAVTDTVISRQTSIAPPPTMHHGGIDYLSNSGYGYGYPQYPMQSPMIAHPFGPYPPLPSGYMAPAGRVQGFMAYDGGHPNFGNAPPGYSNYVSHATAPKGSSGPPGPVNYYNQFNRATTSHPHQSSIPNFGARGPIPRLGLRPPSGHSTVTSFPPQ